MREPRRVVVSRRVWVRDSSGKLVGQELPIPGVKKRGRKPYAKGLPTWLKKRIRIYKGSF